MSTTQSINNDNSRDLAINRTTGRRGFILKLLKKEAKQLAPLLIVLAGCGVFLHLVGLTQIHVMRESYHSTILTLIPILFAVGVGPLLVSQEKENRTLTWMASLPIPPRSIVTSKLIVSLLGLFVIWCFSLAVTYAFSPSAVSTVNHSQMDLLFWPANTFFLMMMGFALAWILPTAGSTLVALVVAASVAGVSAGLAQEWLGRRYDSDNYLSYLLLFQIVITAILSVASIRFGRRSFVAEANLGPVSSKAGRREHSKLAFDRTRIPPVSPGSSLIWQIAWQNRMLWVAAVLIVLMGLASVAYGTGLIESPVILETAAFAACVVLSWLGASVFGSDANHGRIRFLAERGISPFKIWWTRLALPVCCVFSGLLVFYLMLQNFLIGDDYIQNWGPIPALTGFVVAGVLMTFGLAQWLPYWTRSTLIAFCISPVLAIFSLGYIGFLLSFINPPWWLVFVTIGISFVATRIMLRPWMDGRTGLKYWLSHSALLAGALVLPFIPLLFTFATYPNMPTALRQELTEEVKDYMPFTKGIELTIPKKRNEDIYGDYGSHGLSDSNGD